MKVTDNIRYIGVNDHEVDLFEGQYNVPNGMSYNSYVIIDEKIAVLDTVDINFMDEWLSKLEAQLDGRKPDYLVIHHAEPDHSASIMAFAGKYPETVIVSSAPAFKVIEGYFGNVFADRRMIVREGSTLALGSHTLAFIGAPMVHWPEVIMSYECSEKVLFSADGFGKFGALDVHDEWDSEARRYYIGIVGKFGANVQAVLKKAACLDIRIICPLHGPVLTENLDHYIGLYDTWSSYRAETEGVMIAYASVYGHTKAAAALLASGLEAKGVKVEIFDLTHDDMTEAVAAAFRYSKLVLATITYNTEIFPLMHDFIVRLQERNFQGRTVAMIENGSWAPMAAKYMKKMLEGSQNLEILEPVTIRGGMNAANEAQIAELAAGLI